MWKQRIALAAALAALGLAGPAMAAEKGDHAAYKAAKAKAEADYKVARANCDSLKGNPKEVCVAEAKAAEKKAKAEAEAAYENTPKAQAKARKEIAEADYEVAKAKCGAKTGNEKDVCLAEAKANRTKAEAEAKASQKASEARGDAREDQREADYKVAVAKCDSLTGEAKNRCVADAKVRYGM